MGPSPAINITIEADVLAAQRGDQQAFTRLVEATCSLVSSIALAIVRDPDLSRDVAQDVFHSAWRDIGNLREPSSFLPWLRQVTRHRAYHILRSLRRGRRRFDETSSDDLLEAAVDPRPDQHQGLVSRETRRLVTDTVDRLPVDAREVVTLYYREGRSVTQVADLLGLSDAAVRQRLARARERLRSDLLDRAGEELKVSAPGAAFVASVSTAIALGAPAAAAAATFGAGAAAKSGSLVAKLAALVGGAGVGAAGGVSGIVLGLRPLRRQARDEEERKGLRQLQTVAIAVVVAAAFALTMAGRITSNDWAPVGVFLAFVVSLALIYEVWLPRIVRRRHEAEMQADPVAAARRRKRERVGRIVGWSLGLLFGTTGLVIGLWMSR